MYELKIIVSFLLWTILNDSVQAQNSGTYNLLVQKDAYVFEETPGTNYGRAVNLIAGRGLEFGYLYRIYMQFDHTEIPKDASVISAVLHIYLESATADNYRLQLQSNTQPWDESSIAWNKQPASAYRTNIRSKTVGEVDRWVLFDITGTVQGWFDDQVNEGLVITAHDESGNMENCVFFSKESSGCKPYIDVVYTSNKRIPDSPDAPLCNLTGDVTPPEVTLNFSSDPVAVGEEVQVQAFGEDPEGIRTIQLYRGSEFISASGSYMTATSLVTTSTVVPAEPGPIMFFAVAYNDRMQSTRVARRLLVRAEGEPPVVNIYHEPENPALGERVTIYATAGDLSGIRDLNIEVNGVKHAIPVAPGSTVANGELDVEDADIYYDPGCTRVTTYAATAYDQEGNHTTSGTHYILYGNGSGSDSDNDGIDDDIEAILGIDPASDDTDDDGLYDYWEVFGLDRDNDGDIDLDLPGMGASPHHKDLFLEMDWMEDESHSHKPHPWAIQTAINHFLCYGIRLHVDVGAMGGGNPIPHVEDVDQGDGKLYYLLDVKPANCDRARFGIFRYVMCGHGWGQYYGTGNIFLRTDPPNGNNVYDEPYFQAKQLIHEVGHSLGLGHGGQYHSEFSEAYTLDQQCYLFRHDVPSWNSMNYKPNYLSMMNYLYGEQFGLKARTSSGDDIMIQGFSQNDYSYNTLNEYHLNEAAGFEYPLDWGMYTWRRAGDRYHKLNDWFEGYYYIRYNDDWILADGTPIDWDKDGNSTETDVMADIDNDTTYSENLTSGNDIDNFILKICSSHQDRFMANGDSRIEYELSDEICDGQDNDYDGMIDEGFPDLDHDGVADFIDNALEIYNPAQEDINQNFIGDVAEIPPGKATNLHGKFDPDHMYAELTWYRPKPAGALLGYNVYMKDHSGVFKRMGISYPSTLKEYFSHNGPFSLGFEDSLTYYVRPVNIHLIEGEPSEPISFYPNVSTLGTEVPDDQGSSLKCYPNPFTSITHISFSLATPEYVSVTIYNLLGEQVRSLENSFQTGGEHHISWDGTGNDNQKLPSGMYYCSMQTTHTMLTCKIIMSR